MKDQERERSSLLARSAPVPETVTVVIPCFNDGRFLEEAIASLGGEPGQGQGVLLVNDGSTDPGTLEVLEALRERGFTVIDQENLGLPAARNTGWRAARTPYVLFLDADNRVEPDFLQRAAEVLDAEPGVAVVYSDLMEFGERNGLVEQPQVDLAMQLVGNRVDACVLARRDALEQLGGFDASMRGGYEDWELWIRMLGEGFRMLHLPGVGFHYRVRSGSYGDRTDDPLQRAAVVRYVTGKHAHHYALHAQAVIAELHAIQAHDKRLVQQARTVADESLQRAEEAVRAREKAAKELTDLRAEVLQLRADHAGELEQLRSLIAKADVRTVELEGLVRESEARSARLEALLAGLEKEKDKLSEEAHRLVGELDKAMGALAVQREHSAALQGLLGQYEARIHAMENSRLWRMRRQYHKLRALMRTSSDTSKRGFKWLRRVAFLVSRKGRRILRKFFAKVFKALYLITEERPVRIVLGDGPEQLPYTLSGDPYHQWMARHFARPGDLRGYREDLEAFAHRPLVSVVMPVFDPPVKLLDAAIRSVVDQVYPDWELCIADDRSTDPAVRRCLERWSKADDRIRVVFRRENGHISRASNSAMELARGEFTALMDHDDLLAPDALYHVVKRINRRPDVDVLYTDEDKVDEQGVHSEPHFKPQWCPDHLLSRNYFGHLVVVRTDLVREVGGFRTGFEGSQDHDLMLRITERTERIERVPRVLYHWRVHAASAAKGEDVKPYAYQAARKAITEALERRDEPGVVSFLEGYRGYGIRFSTPLKGRVSVIIPTKDKADVLGTCLRSLFRLTDHPDFEVIVVSNGSREKDLFKLLEGMAEEHADRFRWYAHDVPFNFSALMNFGAEKATGSHLLFLNNDTEITHADWMRAMHEQSQRPSIGAVGAKLLYHNDTVQHAGVVIGLGGVAGHTFVGTHRDGPGYFNYVNTINNYSAVTAACMMVERAKLEAIGGWDEDFTVEYNDVDLCLRLQEQGFYNVYLPHVELYHYESLTRGHPHMTKESYERHLREVGLFKERWSQVIADDPCYNPNLSRGAHDFRFEL